MNTSSPPLTNDLTQQLRDLPHSQRRAQLHALMPLLESLFQQGVSHNALASLLTRSGLPLKPESLRQALYRWRKRSRQEPVKASEIRPAAPSGLNPPGPQPPPPTAQAAPRPPISDITNKGDLVRLRESRDPIDLNQLAQLARKK